jgi:hypothetical protein
VTKILSYGGEYAKVPSLIYHAPMYMGTKLSSPQSNQYPHSSVCISVSLEVKSRFNIQQYRYPPIIMPQNKRGSRSKTPKSKSSLKKWETTEYIYKDAPPSEGGENPDASQDDIPLTELEQENVRKMAREFLASNTQGDRPLQPQRKWDGADTLFPP